MNNIVRSFTIICSLQFLIYISASAQNKAWIRGNIVGNNKVDTVVIKIVEPEATLMSDGRDDKYITRIYAAVKQNAFSFEFELKEAIRFKILLGKNRPERKSEPYAYYLEPGDSINIQVSADSLNFSGKGSEKLRILTNARKYYFDAYNRYPGSITNTDLSTYEIFSKFADSMIVYRDSLINANLQRLSQWAYRTIRTYLFVEVDQWRAARMFILISKYRNNRKLLDSLYEKTVKTSPTYYIVPSEENINLIPLFIYYRQYLNEIERSRQRKYATYNNDQSAWLSDAYEFINGRYSGLVREALLVDFFKSYYKGSTSLAFQPIISDYLSEYTFPEYKKYVLELQNKAVELSKNKPAPDFNLQDTSGKRWSLENFKGKILLIDFWFTGCSGCLKQAPFLSKVEEKFKSQNNIVFLNISIDTDKKVWKNSVKKGMYSSKGGISLNIQSNESDVLTKYNVSSYPTLILIDPNGKIFSSPPPVQHDEDVNKLINQIQELM
jgi:peroxiredoxin